jgi:hypothetical protein
VGQPRSLGPDAPRRDRRGPLAAGSTPRPTSSGDIGTRLLADRDEPGVFVTMAELAEVDGDLTPAEEAERNNQRGGDRTVGATALPDGDTGNLRTG